MPTPSATRKKGINSALKSAIKESLKNFNSHRPRSFNPTNPPSKKAMNAILKLLQAKKGGNRTRRNRRRH